MLQATQNLQSTKAKTANMGLPYSQVRASLAIAKASLLAMLRSPTSVVFSLLFPIIFIVVFGAMVDNNAVNVQVALSPDSDTGNVVYKAFNQIKVLKKQQFETVGQMEQALARGRIAAILRISHDSGSSYPPYRVAITTASSAADKSPVVISAANQTIMEINRKAFPTNLTVASLEIKKIPGRIYHSIDFILPGQLGFSLLMAGVFSSAFLLFTLRQNLVLKRFFATPIKRYWLIAGELLSRLFFQIIGFIIMVALGYYVFDFTLANGILTFLEMLLLSVFGLIIFIGMGFIISGVMENESSIAPVANTLTLPQILLCGLFFPVENYPHWLQSFCKLLPLTFFVDGLRTIAFEGIHIWQMPTILLGLLVWSGIISLIAVKTFRWE